MDLLALLNQLVVGQLVIQHVVRIEPLVSPIRVMQIGLDSRV